MLGTSREVGLAVLTAVCLVGDVAGGEDKHKGQKKDRGKTDTETTGVAVVVRSARLFTLSVVTVMVCSYISVLFMRSLFQILWILNHLVLVFLSFQLRDQLVRPPLSPFLLFPFLSSFSISTDRAPDLTVDGGLR